ncbi:MAG: bifunctional 4-hydroxy-3-methylbut-2-enyl diphosphate reductase/30S ribosomal protein S1 [Ruminococcaceae bacterium]|nr:bifunctional 4-hydroxy-3-methylbut-2-enyl diphosphate reductase/30S ribosomal protein S1 [Oscillospiraceae bacterium]
MGHGRHIILADKAGFCFGVDRAVKTVYDCIHEQKLAKVYTLGEIIHNNTINDDLKSLGVTIEDDYLKIPDDANVIIRAHGVSKAAYDHFDLHKINYVDATCPFVKRIHDIVAEIPKENSVCLIAGTANHPEILGIKGFANCQTFIFQNVEELQQILDENSELLQKADIFVVSQTTFSLKEWDDCISLIKLLYTRATVFDTICKATVDRQTEAEELSKQCDLMIVIGAKHSSNSVKLFEVCSENCKTLFIETAKELKEEDLYGFDTIGVTAGASVPAAIIKEVLEAMSEVKNTIINDEEGFDFVAALEESLESMSTDQKVKGIVVGITPTEIQVDIGRKQTGYISYDEYSYDDSIDPATDCKVGDEINVVIMKTNDAEGTISLSKKRFDSANAWDELEACVESGEPVEGTITQVIKGGLIATTTKGLRVFIPGSLTGAPKNEMADLLKTKVSFRVIEVVKQRRRAIGSIKAHNHKARKEAQEKFWATAEVGQFYTGVVKSITNYGVFVDIGGVDGMIHISELSWKRIKHPSDVLAIGDTVEVFIKALEDNKISLGYRRDEDNPWVILKNTYVVGDIIKAKIVGMTSFGAFANVIDGIDGLIHISQISNSHIEKPQDVLTMGEEVTVKITEIDFDKNRVSLSIRALLPPKEKVVEKETSTEEVEAALEEKTEETVVETESVASTLEEPAVVAEEAEVPVEEPSAEKAKEVETEALVEKVILEEAVLEESVVEASAEGEIETVIEEPAEETTELPAEKPEEKVVAEEELKSDEEVTEPAPVEEPANETTEPEVQVEEIPAEETNEPPPEEPAEETTEPAPVEEEKASE